MIFHNRGRIGAFFIPHESTADQPPISELGRDTSSEVSIKTYKIHEIAPTVTPTAMHAPDPKADQATTTAQAPKSDSHNALQNALVFLNYQNSRFAAVGHLLELWQQPQPNSAQLPSQVDDTAYFDIAAHQYGLRMYPIQSDWALVKRLNLPVILALKKGNSEQIVYAAMERWDHRTIHLKIDGAQSIIETDFESLLPFLQGTAYVFWRNILGFDALITEGAPEKAVDVIKSLLRKIGYDQISADPVYDLQTRKAILDFQKRNNLVPDGLIGPLTKILLIKEAEATNYPKLSAEMERGGA